MSIKVTKDSQLWSILGRAKKREFDAAIEDLKGGIMVKTISSYICKNIFTKFASTSSIPDKMLTDLLAIREMVEDFNASYEEFIVDKGRPLNDVYTPYHSYTMSNGKGINFVCVSFKDETLSYQVDRLLNDRGADIDLNEEALIYVLEPVLSNLIDDVYDLYLRSEDTVKRHYHYSHNFLRPLSKINLDPHTNFSINLSGDCAKLVQDTIISKLDAIQDKYYSVALKIQLSTDYKSVLDTLKTVNIELPDLESV